MEVSFVTVSEGERREAKDISETNSSVGLLPGVS